MAAWNEITFDDLVNITKDVVDDAEISSAQEFIESIERMNAIIDEALKQRPDLAFMRDMIVFRARHHFEQVMADGS